MQHKKWTVILYAICDWLAAVLAWLLFFIFRKKFIEHNPIEFDLQFYKAIIILPTLWLILFSIAGEYTDVYKKSRFKELGNTFYLTIFGVIVLFFLLIIDDWIYSSKDYYTSISALFIIHFGIFFIVRMFFLSITKKRLKTGKVWYNTLLIGGDNNAIDVYNELSKKNYSLGFNILGFIDTNGKSQNTLENQLPKLGKLNDLKHLIKENNIEEVIIAVENHEHEKTHKIIDALIGEKVFVKLIPDVYNIITGSVKMDYPYGAILIDVNPEILTPTQRYFKRSFDIFCSIIAIILLTPLLLYAALKVRLSSNGPILYKQERIGLNGKPFLIYKFRSMYIDAEKNGPTLSSDEDERRTPWGIIMRKMRIDELPQFFNVLFGDMSLVGPRPERKFYIDQIVMYAPHYVHVHRVRPGITSWGMVQFGYASNVEEMIKRMKWDLLYVENISMALDLKILLYTIYTVLKGEGK